ncbi:hypothetical protein [Streptomyces sp. 8K308]|uniref:hypothetical protein n=1 Tax=Streptomyces sp. 8K308 TaxID=2530388 RepID=UPI001FB69920|nr:hypothetical protein [Streptomyces sp. 8K308]
MTHQNRDLSQHDDVLDFPGAIALKEAGSVSPPSTEVLATAGFAVCEAIAADTVADAPVTQASLCRLGRRRLLVSAAVVAAAAAAAIAIPVVDLGGGMPPATASAAQLFDAMADVAVAGSVTDASYWKITIKRWVEGDEPHTGDIYIGRHDIVIETQNGRTIRKENPSGTGWLVGEDRVDWEGLDELPTEPGALRDLLAEGAEGSAHEQTVRQAGQLLAGSPASPELRAALFRVLADTPGAEVTEGVKDAVGRTGTEISWNWTEDLRWTARTIRIGS